MSLAPLVGNEPRVARPSPWSVFRRLVEGDLIDRLDGSEYRRLVRRVYDGPQGAMLLACSRASCHVALGQRLFRSRRFDLSGAKNILDVGSGAGQIVGHLLKYADPDARIICTDISQGMLRRARARLESDRPSFVAADVQSMPFADGTFDCVTCGYVLEHLPDPLAGLTELARVMRPGARMLLLATEDNLAGAITSRLWGCRSYTRDELRRLCRQAGLIWRRELWFSRLHEWLHAGGICVELRRGLATTEIGEHDQASIDQRAAMISAR